MLSCESCLHILETILLSGKWFVDTFPNCVACLFILFNSDLQSLLKRSFKFRWHSIHQFFFYESRSWFCIQVIFVLFVVTKFSPMFSSKSFIFLNFMFRLWSIEATFCIWHEIWTEVHYFAYEYPIFFYHHFKKWCCIYNFVKKKSVSCVCGPTSGFSIFSHWSICSLDTNTAGLINIALW